MANIYEIYGTDAHSMTYSLMQAAQVSKMIPPCASILLKPSLVLSGTPDTGATTHSGVLSGCIEYLQKEGFTRISVIESSWVGGNTERAMKACINIKKTMVLEYNLYFLIEMIYAMNGGTK